MTEILPFAEFDAWRQAARMQLQQNMPPAQSNWSIGGETQSSLFTSTDMPAVVKAKDFFISQEFLKLAKIISCHCDPQRWSLLYNALWRLTHGEKHLLKLTADPLVRRLQVMHKAVRRDAHKAKAFVRFRQTQDDAGQEHYVAWHQPDHDILPIVAPFFQRRFAVMHWAILTPQKTVLWDGEHLIFGAGVPETQAPSDDKMEELWRTYYRATFNPARIKLNMMRREMPVRYWATMPETKIIADLLAEAPERVANMIAHQEGMATSAANFLPAQTDLASLRHAASTCHGCPLYRSATCTVFGTGPDHASLMIVGEQPGDEEDKTGLPFVGAAGQVLDRAMREAGLKRESIYVTNAVKHFKFAQRGDKRVHESPTKHETAACRPWLMAEIAALRPRAILTLGVTAGRSLLGPGFSLKTTHGRWHDGPLATKIRPTWHPAAILRAENTAQQENLYSKLVEDLKTCQEI